MILRPYLIINLLIIGLAGSSIKPNDFCLLKLEIHEQVVCKKQQCGFDLCSDDEETCKKLNEWYTIVGNYMDPKKYIQYFEDIKECKPNEYIKLKGSVCSIKNVCKFYEQFKRRNQLLKHDQCICSGNLSFKCAKNYCTDNRHTCSKVILFLNDSTYLKHINKCFNN